VALQGSIDTFALDDVLRLVASTGKTGRLSLVGPRGEGILVVRDGLVLDGAVSTDERANELSELVFELLRFDEGDFAFDAEEVEGYDDDAVAADVDALIAEASDLLAEWREIERVVPGDRALVTLAVDGPDGEVTVSPADWRIIASIGGGATVAELSRRLDASQLATGRQLRSLVEFGLLDVDDSEAFEPLEVPADAPSWGDELDADQGFAAFDSEATAVAVDTNGNGNGHADVDSDVLFDSVHEFSVGPTEPPEEREELVPAGDIDAGEFARRLAELPPRAAKAVAAAARAGSAEEREAALAELDGTGEEVDHEVLLALLGPVES
jgi:hypothetical protein